MRSARAMALSGGILAILVSGILGISLLVRDTPNTPLHIFTASLAAIAGALSMRASRQPYGEGLLRADAILAVALLPQIFGFVFLFYALPLFTLLLATMLFVIAKEPESDTKH